jgi:hypothetical protein
MTAPEGRHPQWLAERTRLMVIANAVECPSAEFDAAIEGMTPLEQALTGTKPATKAEAAAKLQYCAIINAEGSVLDRDDAGDLMAEIAPFLAPVIDRQAWDDAKGIYVAARAEEVAYDAEHCSIPDKDPNRSAMIQAIPAPVWAESERLGQMVSDAEDVLMDIPSPNAAAFAFKCRIAHGDGRETDCWNAMLDAEAKRFADDDTNPRGEIL